VAVADFKHKAAKADNLSVNRQLEAEACGHVGALGGGTDYSHDLYNSSGAINGVLQINLGSDQPSGCVAGVSDDVVIHEFMHGLGPGSHFQGFGEGSAVSSTAWNVLMNLYDEMPGAHVAALTIDIYQ
jgi:hypothetical protein